MSWEQRGGKGQYYTWTINFAGRRRRIYLGKAGDPVAELASAYETLQRIALELQKRARAEELRKFRNAPLEAGIEATTKILGDMLRGGMSPKPAEQGASPPNDPTTDATHR